MKNKKRILFLESDFFYKNIISIDNKLFDVNYDGGFIENETDLKDYDLIVYTLYSSLKFNFILLLAKKMKIPSLLLLDGVSEFSNFFKNKHMKRLNMVNYHPVISDYLGVVGDKSKKYFETRGCVTVKYLPNHMSTTCDENKSEKIKVLITTANTAYHDDKEFNQLVNLINITIDMLDNNSLDYIFRIFDNNLIEALNIRDKDNVIDGDFDTVLNDVSHVITTPSSISLISMKASRPVAHLIYRDYPAFFQSGWNIIPELFDQDCLMSFIRKDENRMAFQYSEVKSNYDCEDFSLLVEKLTSVEKNKYNFDTKYFIDNFLFLMINSKMNINFEYRIRKLYWYLKKSKFSLFVKKFRNSFINR